jgi:hypothetical protein
MAPKRELAYDSAEAAAFFAAFGFADPRRFALREAFFLSK